MLNPLQQKLLETLKWFHEYCEENDIKYYVCGGTQLGASRHGGFIPWDDDVDVAMPRPDYEKLIASLKDKTGRYVLETPYSGNKDYLYTFAKLYDTTTTLVEHTKHNCKRGIYLDIFPLDGVGNSSEDVKKIFPKVDRANKFLMTRSCAIRKGRSFYKNAAICVSRLVPQFIVNDKKLSIKVDILAKKCNYDDSKYVVNYMGAYGIKEMVEKRIMGTPKKYAFEDIYVYGVEYDDEYLTHLYGDWRKLPPEDKRVSHHDFMEIDLERSYLE